MDDLNRGIMQEKFYRKYINSFTKKIKSLDPHDDISKLRLQIESLEQNIHELNEHKNNIMLSQIFYEKKKELTKLANEIITQLDAYRIIYQNKYEDMHKHLPNQFTNEEKIKKYYMKWVSSEEKLDIFLDALPVDFQDRSAFKSALLNTDHPEHKPHWVDGQNTLIYLFEQLQDEYIKLTDGSLMQTLHHYFCGRVTKRNPTGKLTYGGLKKAHLETVKIDNIELIKEILKKIK